MIFDNFTGQSFFDAKIQDIKGKIDVLNAKANDNVMNYLGQIVQLATAVYSLYNGVGEVQAIYTGVSAAFHNAPDDQSYADTLNNYLSKKIKQISRLPQRMLKTRTLELRPELLLSRA